MPVVIDPAARPARSGSARVRCSPAGQCPSSPPRADWCCRRARSGVAGSGKRSVYMRWSHARRSMRSCHWDRRRVTGISDIRVFHPEPGIDVKGFHVEGLHGVRRDDLLGSGERGEVVGQDLATLLLKLRLVREIILIDGRHAAEGRQRVAPVANGLVEPRIVVRGGKGGERQRVAAACSRMAAGTTDSLCARSRSSRRT